jgi:predicted DNA-binding protein with PD1-like motif
VVCQRLPFGHFAGLSSPGRKFGDRILVYIYMQENGARTMNRKAKLTSVLSVLLAGGVAFMSTYRLSGQQPSPAPEASHVVKAGNAPGLKVTDLGSSGHTYRVNMTKGDEIMSGLLEFAEKNHIRNGHFTGLGAIDQGVLQWADPVHKGHKTTEINEEAEIVSLVGSIGTDKDGKPTVHAHTVVALSDGTTRGGHLVEARVSIICQVFVVEEEGAATTASR